jgi:hypothetical protein
VGGVKVKNLLCIKALAAVQYVEQGAGLVGHDDEISNRLGIRVAKRVRYPPWPDYGSTRRNIVVIISDANPESPFQYVPRLIVLMMNVTGRHPFRVIS